ncbi:hypothetical protein L915_20018 [Phytophthora nicotianae]|uniref:Peptidase S1 domain-containing protein n=1 Tax=Phytophthora nicotianae TaxID=4792 RepID=W2FSE9_PHYNI|nr:hypothetical protein L915_20018 [Phytophthora nicotianae]
MNFAGKSGECTGFLISFDYFVLTALHACRGHFWVANCCQVVYNDKDYEVERTEDFEDLDLSLLKMRGLEDASYLQPEEALQCADCDIDWV